MLSDLCFGKAMTDFDYGLANHAIRITSDRSDWVNPCLPSCALRDLVPDQATSAGLYPKNRSSADRHSSAPDLKRGLPVHLSLVGLYAPGPPGGGVQEKAEEQPHAPQKFDNSPPRAARTTMVGEMLCPLLQIGEGGTSHPDQLS